MFKKLRFRSKVFIGYIVLIIFCVVISSISLYQLRQIQRNLELIYDHPLTVSNAVRDINICINGMHRSMKDVVLAKNETELDSAILHVNELQNLALNAFDVVFDRFLGDMNDVKNAYKAFIDWEDIRNEVIRLKKEGKDNDAAEITKGKGAKHVALLFENTRIMTDYAQNKANEIRAETKNSYNNTFSTLFLFILIAIGSSVFITIIISKSILEPIQNFILGIRTLYLKEESVSDEKAYTSG